MATYRSGFGLRLLFLLLIGCGLSGFTVRAAEGPGAKASTLEQADRLYEEKSYAGALEAYERLLKAGQVPAKRRDEVQYRIAVSLGKSEKWDRALEYGLDFVKSHQKTVWEPRGLYWLGRLYLGIPHQGWKVGQKVYRGNDVPKAEGAEKPEQVVLHEQDMRNTRDALEAARVFYPTYRAEWKTEAEEIQLNFDLARVLQNGPDFYLWAQEQKWAPPADKTWEIDPAAAYSPEWAPPKKVMYLYESIKRLALGVKDNRPNAQRSTLNAHSAALSLFGKAVWLQGYHSLMQQYAFRWEDGKRIEIPYPYQDVKAEAPLRQLVKEFPDDPVRGQAQFTLGTFLENRGEYAAAVAEHRRLIEELPKDKWVEDARFHLDQIARRQLSVDINGAYAPGEKAEVRLSYRNIKQVHFEVFRVKLEDVLARPAVVNDPRVAFNHFTANFGKIEPAQKLYGPLVEKWDWATEDKGDYQHRSATVPIPIKETGAYVVEATAPGIRMATVLLVTDLVVVQKITRDEGLFFVTNARTGEPVADAEIVAKQWWHEGGSPRTSVKRGKTSAEGLYTLPLERGPGRNGFSVAALAFKTNRYAVTEQLGTWWDGDNPDIFKVYSITDRSVYRPMQTVFYRQMVMRRTKGELKPARDQQVRVQVRDPKGTLIHDKAETANEFGSISGQFGLSADAPLGEYHFQVNFPGVALGVQYNGANRFRVEEYKKPEFEVTVKPAAERVRMGEPASAQILASYYFGGPVPNAKVSYRVYRTFYRQWYRFPRPFDFMYRYYNDGDYNTYYRNGEVVKQGETKTDAKGIAEISFPTTEQDTGAPNSGFSYTIEADVQDASRRVISGTGAVKATRHDVAVFLDFRRGYATKGDLVEVEIVTMNPSDQPVSVDGTAKVYRYPETPDGKETLFHEEPLKTDKNGRAFLKWKNEAGGRFRVAFETKDTAGLAVSNSTDVWVSGPELEKGRFLFRNVLLKVQDLYYEEGQTANVLLVTPEPGCTVLLTREVNNEISERRLVKVPGRSLELKVPLAARDVPNVYLSAVMVRDGQMFMVNQEIFVPPVRQFATVTVEAEKERYQPGEKAKLRLQAKDWQGRPLRTELSVAVTDASLAYIQKDYAPDIRVYYYGDRRSQSVPNGGSPGIRFHPGQEDTQPQRAYNVHEWGMPEGMGMIPDWPGDQGGYYPGNFRFPGGGGFGGFGGRAQTYRSVSGELATPGAAPAAPEEARADRDDGRKEAAADKEGAGGLQDAQVRSSFADTAFWIPSVVTDTQGTATVEVTWPDNLTQWRTVTVGTTATAQVGSGETRVVTKKDLLVRLQAPRFFVERDLVVLSANVHNYTPETTRAKVLLTLGDDTAEIVPHRSAGILPASGKTGRKAGETPALHAVDTPETWVEIPKDGEKRIDWVIRVQREGQLKVRMTAQAPSAADAMEMSFPVLVHGVERQVSRSGVMRAERKEQLAVAIELPKERKAGSSEVVVQLNPSMAAVMLDALPYLLDYPYGCIEQAISRFLPAVVTAKTLKDLGYNLEDLRQRARVLEEKEREGDAARPGGKTAANSPYTYPKGRPGTIRIREMAQHLPRSQSPVFSSEEMDNIVREGLARIRQAQNSDGGWGWWPGNSSDPYMTAYALYGLLTAKQAGVPVEARMIDRGLDYLKARFLEDDNFHRMAYEARVLAMDPRYRDGIQALTAGRLYDNRERLSPYSRAFLATALHLLGDNEKAQVLLRNIETTAKVDPENGTANWGDNDRFWWYWWNNKVETNAAILQAYMAIRPNAELPPMMVKWMVNNRRGGFWHSTKETAMAVYALADYVRVNKELSPEYTLTLNLGDRVQRSYTVTRDNALFFDNQFVVPDELLSTGKQTLTLSKDGPGTLYFAAYTTYFSLEEPIRATGNEIAVQRRYFRLIPGTASGAPEAKPLDVNRPNPFLTRKYELLTAGGEWTVPGRTEGGPRYKRDELRAGDTLTSGDLVEVELHLESKNDYDYLVFEDMKPAGCEPVELRSGGSSGGGVYANMELRDQKVAFFLNTLPQGKRMLTYRLRAEIPGRFHVLPTNGYAMYAPDIRALSDEITFSIRDGEEG
jgi:alpha-2-macroglobulin